MKTVFQPIYDKVYAAIIAQGKSSMNGHTCCYRANDGSKCAIGHLLSDEQIAKYNLLEGTLPSAFKADLLEELVPGGTPISTRNFLIKLQYAHDEAADADEASPGCFITKFIEEMIRVAEHFQLDPIKS